MDILSLFDGMSCGHIAFDKLNIPIDNYYAYEIDKYAIKTTLHNYPNTKELGDVFAEDFTKYKDIDFLIGGSPCFTKGHYVLTDKGYKDISEIKVGDMVLTHTAKYQKVIRINQRKSILSKLKIMGYPEFTTTKNHPFYCIQKSKTPYKEYSNIHTWRKFTEVPIWKKVEDLDKQDFCGQHIIPTNNINEYNLDEETCWILGRYLADGHIRKSKRKERKDSYQYQLILSIGKNKLEYFRDTITKHHYSLYPHSTNVYRACFSSMELVNFIIDHDFGQGAHNKKIPEFIFDLPNHLRIKFLDGYLSGDGCYCKESDSYTASTVSPRLALGLQRLITSVYRTNVGVSISKNQREHYIEGRLIKSNYPLYNILFKKGLRKQSVAHESLDIMWTQVKEITNTNIRDTVYNIEVENDNSYTVNNCIVHNCTYWSIAKSSDKRETTASGMGWELFSQYVRALDEAKPKYFIYENNKSMSRDIYNSISETFGFEPIMINSALLSAQNRQRYNWVGKRNEDYTYSKVEMELPADRGILLRDVLDGLTDRDKGRTVMGSTGRTTTREYFKKHQGNMTLEPVKELTEREIDYMVRDHADRRWNFCQRPDEDEKGKCLVANVSKGVPYNVCAEKVVFPLNETVDGKARTIRATCYKDGIRNMVANDFDKKTCIAEPVNVTKDNKSHTIKAQYFKNAVANFVSNKGFDATAVAEKVANSSQCFVMPRDDGKQTVSKQYRVYNIDGKGVTLCENGGGLGAKTGLYAIPIEFDGDIPIKAISATDGKEYHVYRVQNGLIYIKGNEYPIKLSDGYYIIRKLTVSECKRLQTVPEEYEFPVSDSQAYKMLGNGWTCDVIAYIISNTLKLHNGGIHES